MLTECETSSPTLISCRRLTDHFPGKGRAADSPDCSFGVTLLPDNGSRGPAFQKGSLRAVTANTPFAPRCGRSGRPAAALPHGAERPEETEIRALLAAFRFKFIPEMLLDVALVKAILDGPEAARDSRFSAAGAA